MPSETTTKSRDSSYRMRCAGHLPMLKNQEQTLEKAIIDLGEFEATGGLTFVRTSRTMRLVDLLNQPIPFDRF